MGSMDVDDVDEGILYLLQSDARRITTEKMGEAVGVSVSTARNRIDRLEKIDIRRGYYPDIDYDRASLQLHVQFICSAPKPRRERLANRAREVSGVVSIREALNSTDNVQIEAVGTDTDDIARISDSPCEIGLEVRNAKILKSERLQPFEHFGEGIVKDEFATDDR